MEKYTIIMDRNNLYSENECITQNNLYIQCNSYQVTKGIFQGTGKKNFHNLRGNTKKLK